jgi:predicted deacetylase
MRECLYLIRFDDICPTMRWDTWDALEAHLDLLGLSPILAVVPDNRDPKLVAGPPRADFWERVRRWQAKGWTIAMHGYQHRYVTREAGIIGLNRRSEFAGLPRHEQERKLSAGLAIFRKQGVRVDAWVAPAHSFDRTTVDLLVGLGITVISDGFWHLPFTEDGRVTWVPQQIWHFIPRPAGVWTVCSHPNAWSAADLDHYMADLERYSDRIASLSQVLERYGSRTPSMGDRITGWFETYWRHGLRQRLARAVKAGLRMEGRHA